MGCYLQKTILIVDVLLVFAAAAAAAAVFGVEDWQQIVMLSGISGSYRPLILGWLEQLQRQDAAECEGLSLFGLQYIAWQVDAED
jgi:hypothetical protein